MYCFYVRELQGAQPPVLTPNIIITAPSVISVQQSATKALQEKGSAQG